MLEHLGGEVRGEGEGKALLDGEARAEVAGAEEGDGDVAVLAGKSFHGLIVDAGAEISAELGKKFGEVVAGLAEIATQCAHGMEVAAGSAAEAEVDAAGIEGFKGAELLGYYKRSVVGEHDPAAADANCAGCRGDVSDQDGSRGAGEAVDGVVLREPEATIAPLLGVAGEIDGAGDGRGGSFDGVHADEIKDGNRKRHRLIG